MEHTATIHTEGESASNDERVLFNPADDSSSSYEASSASENEPQNAVKAQEDPPTFERWQGKRSGNDKTTSSTPAITSQPLLQPNTNAGARTVSTYSDEWIKKDAARWAETFTGPVDSENVSEDDRPVNSKPRPYRHRSKKQKTEKLETRKHKAKHPKGTYNDSYRQLLNEEIRDALRPTEELHDRLPQSQIGVTIWTSIEKEIFFKALSRIGTDNVRGIASRIGSKSELEVQEYMQLLHQGMVEKISNEPRRQLLGFTDMPAAVQLSQECCSELEKAADALASRQNRYEEHKEHQKWGESWVIDSEVNHWVEQHLAEKDGNHDLREVLPAAELLNLSKWLELSSRIFMNPAAPREEENWQSLAEPGEEPSIRATAFTDFHRLAISITKKLVSATIFCTMSRLRAMDSRSFNRYDIVKPVDVEAAAKIIGLEIDSNKFWRECPRRCNLDIVRSASAKAYGQSPMEYDEVEGILHKRSRTTQSAATSDGEASRAALSVPASPRASSPGSRSSASLPVPGSQPLSEAEDVGMHSPTRDLAFEYMEEIEAEYGGPIDPSASEFEQSNSHNKQTKKRIMVRKALDRAHAEYTEAVDLRASLLEEQRLWEILKQDPPFAIKPDEVNVPTRPMQERKAEDDVKDWRDSMEFWSQWEMLDRPVPTQAFSRPSARRSRQRASTRDTEVDGSSSEATSEKGDDEMDQDEVMSNSSDGEEVDPDSSDDGSVTP